MKRCQWCNQAAGHAPSCRRKWSEAHFQREVIRAARAAGYLTMHIGDARRPVQVGTRTRIIADAGVKGFPDTVLLHPVTGDLMVAELKTIRNRSGVEPEQRAWLAAFTLAGVDSYVWTPADLEAIDARLEAGRRRGKAA